MNILIVHAHHEPKSFNGALTQRAKETLTADGHDVVISDLYAMKFDPISDRRNFTTTADAEYLNQQAEESNAAENGGFAADIEAELRKLEACDLLIFQCPMWWFGMPAILKGWVDRVFAHGRAYGDGRWYRDGIFTGKRAMLSMTTGGPETMYSEGGLNPHVENLMAPIEHGVFGFTGFRVLPAHFVWGPSYMSAEQRSAALDGYANHLRRCYELEGEAPPNPADYPPPEFRRV